MNFPRGVRSLHTEASGSAPPDAFGPFRVLHQIGAGTLGPVFRAYEPDLDRLVAVKLFKLNLPPDQVHRLVAELEALIRADLVHPAIAAPIATGISDVFAFLAQEFVPAESLDVVLRAGRLPVSEVWRVVSQLAAALDAAASLDVLHGALHERDILIEGDEVRLTGLGVAQALERIGVTTPTRRPFSAPERLGGGPWNRRADVFALAVLAHELLWGTRVPAAGEAAAAALTDVPGADLEALRDVFARGLAEEPADRCRTAREFTDALEEALGAATDVARGEREAVPDRFGDSHTDDDADVLDSLRLRDQQLPLETYDSETTFEIELPVIDTRTPTPEELQAFALEAAGDAGAEGPELESPEEETAAEPAPAGVERPASHVPPLLATVERTTSGQEARSTLWPVVVAAALFAAVGFAAGNAVATLGGLSFFGGIDGGGRARPATSVEVPATVPEPGGPPGVSDAPPAAPVISSEPEGAPVPDQSPPEPPVAAVASPEPPALAATGRLFIRSSPDGARVEVNGREVGRTPLTLDDLAFGTYVARVTHDGHVPVERRVSISPTQLSLALILDLPPAPSSGVSTPPRVGVPPPPEPPPGTTMLRVDSRPPGADVFIDGRRVGRTPFVVKDIAIGSYQIRLELAGYQAWATSIQLAPDRENHVGASLER